MARAFAQSGAKVAALDLNEDAVKALANELKAEGFICEGYKANVLDPEALEAVHQAVLADLGPCDILVNGAGGNNPRATTDNEYQHEAKEGGKSFFDLEASGVDFVFKLNFQGTLLPTQAFAKDMVAKKHGVILNISSMNAYTPLTKIPAYSAAKAGISNFTQWLATHFAGTGIRCNAIAPGFLVSAQNKALLFNEDGTPTARSAKILNGTPMGRFVDADELLGATLFLCYDKSASAISGVVLPVDAGFAAYSGVEDKCKGRDESPGFVFFLLFFCFRGMLCKNKREVALWPCRNPAKCIWKPFMCCRRSRIWSAPLMWWSTWATPSPVSAGLWAF